jgi:hypothetical protein
MLSLRHRCSRALGQVSLTQSRRRLALTAASRSLEARLQILAHNPLQAASGFDYIEHVYEAGTRTTHWTVLSQPQPASLCMDVDLKAAYLGHIDGLSTQIHA